MARRPEQAGELLTGSIDDYLLALADGIHKAQRQLSQLSITLQPGQPAISYQLPKVDFEFRISFELAASSEGEAPGAAGGQLRVRPADAGGGGRESTAAQAASIIKGSFVAVPALGGKPPPVIDVRLERVSPRRLNIAADVSTAAGEKLAGIPVEFNVDRELSRQLNDAAKAKDGLDRQLAAATDLWNGLVHTDANGLAQTVLEVSPDEPVGTFVTVMVDVLQETRTINFEVEARGETT